MFERFTERAKKAMELARQEALHLECECLGTEHILLGLLMEGSGLGAEVLRQLDVADVEKLRSQVKRLAGKRPVAYPLSGDELPLTLHARKAIDDAIDAARLENGRHVGTEHLLLCLIRDSETTAVGVLTNLGLELDGVKAKVFELLEADSREARDHEVERQLQGSDRPAPPDRDDEPSGQDKDMPHVRYRDLAVWPKADELAYQVYLATKGFPKDELTGIVTQLRHAAVSVPARLARSHGGGASLSQSFLGARGALVELQSLLDISLRLEYLEPAQHQTLKDLVDDVDRRLREFPKSETQ